MFPLDKQAHFWSGLAIALAVALFFGWIVGLAVAISAAIAKEVVDYVRHGKPDYMDAIATTIGGLVMVVVYLFK